MATIQLSADHLEQLLDHARREYPYEACGLIGGRDGQAEAVTRVPNASLSPQSSFEMERQAMVDGIIEFQRAGQEVIAIYHSHPESAAVPSDSDVAQATWPDAIYVIISLSDPDQPVVQAWSIRHGRVEPAELSVL